MRDDAERSGSSFCKRFKPDETSLPDQHQQSLIYADSWNKPSMHLFEELSQRRAPLIYHAHRVFKAFTALHA